MTIRQLLEEATITSPAKEAKALIAAILLITAETNTALAHKAPIKIQAWETARKAEASMATPADGAGTPCKTKVIQTTVLPPPWVDHRARGARTA